MSEVKHLCGKCGLCVKDDGLPYCVMKDLFTTVRLDDECSEKDITGQDWFVEEKKDGRK